MSSTTVTTIYEFSRLLVIYGGSVIFLMGTFGSCANLCLFATKRYRRIPCSLFIWTGSLIDLIVLCVALYLYVVLDEILQYESLAFNLYLCKAKLYFIDALLPIPIFCVCLSAFDRFCITSRNAARRQWSTQKRVRIMVAVVILLSFIYRLPDLYFVTTSPANEAGSPMCIFSTSAFAYTQFHSYFTFPILQTTAPITILIILMLLTRANLRSFTAQERGARLERQMTLMVLLQAMGTACIIPYTIYIFYFLATKTMEDKSDYRMAAEYCYYLISLLFFYAHYALSFYIYLIASSDVRQKVRQTWYKIRGKLGLANRIAPVTGGINGRAPT